jgi:hypothetical protein
MKDLTKLFLAFFALLLCVPAYLSAKALPGRDHPAYLRALTDLRHARAHLERPDGGELREQEKKAIHEIDEAIADLNDHPPVDVRMDWSGRLHRALELVNRAHNDVAQEEDNGSAQGLQQHALQHIDKAHHHIEEAIAIVR